MKLDQVNGYIRKAGGQDALDLDVAEGPIDNEGVLGQDSQLGYRILWNYTDNNQNTISGAPSQRAVISLQIQDLSIPDFNNLLTALDVAAAANGGATDPNNLHETTYSLLALPSTATAAQVNAALQALASQLELDMNYTSAGTVGFQNARYGRTGSITAISVASPTVITAPNNMLSNGDQITIVGSDSIPSIDGQYYISNVSNEYLFTTSSANATVGATYTNNSQTFTVLTTISAGTLLTCTGTGSPLTSGTLTKSSGTGDSTITFSAWQSQNTFTVPATVTTAGANGTWTSGIAQAYPTPTTDLDSDYLAQQQFYDAIVTDLLQEPTTKITTAAQTAGNFTPSSQARDVILTFTVPQDITTSSFYQIYRTAKSVNALTDPGDDMQVVFEANPTAAQIIAGVISVTDITPDAFRGAALYTNPNQEGIAQADEAPPYAKDVAIYKNIAFYANTQTLHQLQISLLGVANLIGTSINIAGITYTFGSTEDIATGTVGVATSGTPAQNVDTTARSLVRVINRYAANTIINAFYLSGPTDVPGLILLENRDLVDPVFYVVESSPTVGKINFSPNLAPPFSISAISAANPTQITSTTQHGLSTGEEIAIVGSNSTPSIDGLYDVTVIDSYNFTIPVNVSVAGTTGGFVSTESAQSSDNEIKPNRLYYSKQQQFEAVPILNYFDVGSGDKEIYRVIPLRDSIFILKNDGVYYITGDSTTDLTLDLFDSSINIVAADSATVGNNQIYLLSDQGAVSISTTGTSIISRSIENEILPLVHDANIPSAAFGVFYQTDRKYILFMPLESTDTVAQTAWVYNNITNGWVQWDMSKTCGVINTRVDQLFLGASDITNVEIERKDFDRTDFADRQYTRTIINYNATTQVATLDSLLNIAIGDVLVQEQTITTPYLSYNVFVETKITAILSTSALTVMVDSQYPLLPGVVTQYKAFQCTVTWAPEALGDPGILKHFREATLRFKESRITEPSIGFSSDLQQGVEFIDLIGPGLGNWGMFPWGTIQWGGDLLQRGFRTYIPLGKQRCSIINCTFEQLAAREEWQIEGLTLTYEISSTRINK